MMREPRRRSPESSRRRRAERRTSREQLAAAATTAPIAPAMPSQTSHRSRAYSTTSGSSSTSSSLLNISNKGRRFGLRSFFTARTPRRLSRRSSKKHFRAKNGSSSSLDSELAYGKGYISKDSMDEKDVHPDYPIPHGVEQQHAEPLFGPDGRPALHRAQTDEEILELGRKLSAYARAENRRDLERAGRPRPSQFAAAAAAVAKLSRHNTLDSQRGLGPSKPHHGDSDDGDWESASDTSSSESADDGLTYGAHFPTHDQPSRPEQPPTIFSQRPPEVIRPPNRKSSAVDPAMFGPMNSLRGLINTPCGYRPGEYRPGEYNRQEPTVHLDNDIPPIGSASLEARPMRTVYAAPTSDPNRFDAVTASVVSSQQAASGYDRPAPVPIQPTIPIQAPKPRVPVSTRVLEEKRMEEEARAAPSSRRKSDGAGLAEAAVAGIAAAAIDAAVASSRKDHDRRDKDERRETNDSRGHHDRYEPNTWRQPEHPARALSDVVRKEPELTHDRDDKAESSRRESDRKDRRSKRGSVIITDERESKRHEIPEPRKEEKLSQSSKSGESSKSTALGPNDRKPTREERRAARAETQRMLREVQAEIAREREKALAHRKGTEEGKPGAPGSGRHDAFDVVGQRQDDTVAPPSTRPPIDPFQFQVPDDAFATPQYATPKYASTPSITTVDREPDFSHLEAISRPMERLSRRDSYEYELQQARSVAKETQQSTVPAHAENIAAAISVVKREQERSRSRAREPVRDKVQEAADAAYRESRLAQRLEEEQIRSRSASPEPSVVEKWTEKGDDPIVRIVTPPEMDHRHEKSAYDAPNADVRIDNVIMPRDLPRYKAPINLGDRVIPVFTSRDPSCERERPLLNLVLPTPAVSPSPERQRVRAKDAEKDVQSADSKREVVADVKEVKKPRADSPSSGGTPRVTEDFDADDDHHGRVKETPATTSPERETPHKQKSSKTSSGWGIIAAAVAGSTAAAVASATHDERSNSPELESKKVNNKPSREWDRNSSPHSGSRSVIDDLDDVPPKVGPKPSSPRDTQMSGAFADDLDFTATVAAGLKGSGFDPNIVIDDPTFRRRDSPPGSEKGFPSQRTDEFVDLGLHSNAHTRGVDTDVPFDDEFETTPKLSKKERKKRDKASQRQSMDTEPSDFVLVSSDTAHSTKEQEHEVRGSSEQTPRATMFDETYARPDHDLVLDREPNTLREASRALDLMGQDAEEPEFVPKLSKKEQKKREKEAARAAAAAALESSIVEPATEPIVEQEPKLSESLEVVEDYSPSRPHNDAHEAVLPSESVAGPAMEDSLAIRLEEYSGASTPKLSKKEQKRRAKELATLAAAAATAMAERTQELSEEPVTEAAAEASMEPTAEAVLDRAVDFAPESATEEASTPLLEAVVEEEQTTTPKLSKKEQKRRAKEAAALTAAMADLAAEQEPTAITTTKTTTEPFTDPVADPTLAERTLESVAEPVPEVLPETATEPQLEGTGVEELDTAPKLSKKEQKRRAKQAALAAALEDTTREPPTVSTTEPVIEEPVIEKAAIEEAIADEPVVDTLLPTPAETVDSSEVTPAPKLSKKEQKRRDKEAAAAAALIAAAAAEALPETPVETKSFNPVPLESVEEQEQAPTPKLSKKEQKKRDKEAAIAAALAEANGETSAKSEPTVESTEPSTPAEGPEDVLADTPKLSKKERKKLEKAAQAEQAAQLLKGEDSPSWSHTVHQDEFVDASEGWHESAVVSKEPEQAHASYSAWEDTPEVPAALDEITVPVSTFDDIVNGKEDSDQPKKSKKDKKNRRKSLKDYSEPPDQDDPPDKSKGSFVPSDRDVSSVVSAPTHYGDQDEAKPYSRSRSRAVDDDLESVASVPTTTDDRKKKEKRSSGGFFGFFGKSLSTNGDDQNDNGSGKAKAGTIGAGVGLMGAVVAAAAELIHPKATQASEEESSDAVSKSLEPAGSDQDTLLVDPEIKERVIKPARDPLYGDLLPLPPSEPGSPKLEQDLPSLPDSPQLPPSEPVSPGSRADEPQITQRERSASSSSQVVDPEIVERVIKPAVDPQYGDLLPLPPSVPGSPITEEGFDLPPLPDSRPETPPEERERLRATTPFSHRRRRSNLDTPSKSTSQTAIPLQLRFGSSPSGFLRSSPIASPITPSQPDFGSAVKKLPRPTSWDNSREIKPLRLLDKNGNSSLGTESRRQEGRNGSLSSEADSPSERTRVGVIPFLAEPTRKSRAHTVGSSTARSLSPFHRTTSRSRDPSATRSRDPSTSRAHSHSTGLATLGAATAGLAAAALLDVPHSPPAKEHEHDILSVPPSKSDEPVTLKPEDVELPASASASGQATPLQLPNQPEHDIFNISRSNFEELSAINPEDVELPASTAASRQATPVQIFDKPDLQTPMEGEMADRNLSLDVKQTGGSEGQEVIEASDTAASGPSKDFATQQPDLIPEPSDKSKKKKKKRKSKGRAVEADPEPQPDSKTASTLEQEPPAIFETQPGSEPEVQLDAAPEVQPATDQQVDKEQILPQVSSVPVSGAEVQPEADRSLGPTLELATATDHRVESDGILDPQSSLTPVPDMEVLPEADKTLDLAPELSSSIDKQVESEQVSESVVSPGPVPDIQAMPVPETSSALEPALDTSVEAERETLLDASQAPPQIGSSKKKKKRKGKQNLTVEETSEAPATTLPTDLDPESSLVAKPQEILQQSDDTSTKQELTDDVAQLPEEIRTNPLLPEEVPLPENVPLPESVPDELALPSEESKLHGIHAQQTAEVEPTQPVGEVCSTPEKNDYDRAPILDSFSTKTHQDEVFLYHPTSSHEVDESIVEEAGEFSPRLVGTAGTVTVPTSEEEPPKPGELSELSESLVSTKEDGAEPSVVLAGQDSEIAKPADDSLDSEVGHQPGDPTEYPASHLEQNLEEYTMAAQQILPLAAGSVLEHAHDDSVETRHESALNSADQDGLMRDPDALSQAPTSSQAPAERGLDDPRPGPEDPPVVQGSYPGDKSVDDTTSRGLDTAVSVPNSPQQLPTSDINDSQVHPDAGPREIGELEKPTPVDDQNAPLDPTHTQPPAAEQDAVVETTTAGDTDLLQTLAEPMVESSKKKKAKKGKKKQQTAQDAIIQEESVSSVPAEDAPSTDAPPETEAELIAEASSSSSQRLAEPEPVEIVEEDPWAELTEKKTKKDKKKRQGTQVTDDIPPEESSPAPEDLEEKADDPAPKDAVALETTSTPTQPENEGVAEESNEVPPGLASQAGEPALQEATDEAPVVIQPENEAVTQESAAQETPEALIDDPSSGKKKKKDKKKKKQQAQQQSVPVPVDSSPDGSIEEKTESAGHVEPEATVEQVETPAEQSAEDNSVGDGLAETLAEDLSQKIAELSIEPPIKVPADASVEAEASAETPAEAPVEPVWDEPSSGKKKKKDKKKKQQAAAVSDAVEQADNAEAVSGLSSEKVLEPASDLRDSTEATPSSTTEKDSADISATTADEPPSETSVEPPADDLQELPISGKKKKKDKKKRQSIASAIDSPTTEEPALISLSSQDGAVQEAREEPTSEPAKPPAIAPIEATLEIEPAAEQSPSEPAVVETAEDKVTVLESATDPTSEPRSAESTAIETVSVEPASAEAAVVESADTEQAAVEPVVEHAAEPTADEEVDVPVSGKKAKKDKKKKKKQAQQAAAELAEPDTSSPPGETADAPQLVAESSQENVRQDSSDLAAPSHPVQTEEGDRQDNASVKGLGQELEQSTPSKETIEPASSPHDEQRDPTEAIEEPSISPSSTELEPSNEVFQSESLPPPTSSTSESPTGDIKDDSTASTNDESPQETALDIETSFSQPLKKGKKKKKGRAILSSPPEYDNSYAESSLQSTEFSGLPIDQPEFTSLSGPSKKSNKKRQSVTFADPIAEHREIPALSDTLSPSVSINNLRTEALGLTSNQNSEQEGTAESEIAPPTEVNMPQSHDLEGDEPAQKDLSSSPDVEDPSMADPISTDPVVSTSDNAPEIEARRAQEMTSDPDISAEAAPIEAPEVTLDEPSTNKDDPPAASSELLEVVSEAPVVSVTPVESQETSADDFFEPVGKKAKKDKKKKRKGQLSEDVDNSVVSVAPEPSEQQPVSMEEQPSTADPESTQDPEIPDMAATTDMDVAHDLPIVSTKSKKDKKKRKGKVQEGLEADAGSEPRTTEIEEDVVDTVAGPGLSTETTLVEKEPVSEPSLAEPEESPITETPVDEDAFEFVPTKSKKDKKKRKNKAQTNDWDSVPETESQLEETKVDEAGLLTEHKAEDVLIDEPEPISREGSMFVSDTPTLTDQAENGPDVPKEAVQQETSVVSDEVLVAASISQIEPEVLSATPSKKNKKDKKKKRASLVSDEPQPDAPPGDQLDVQETASEPAGAIEVVDFTSSSAEVSDTNAAKDDEQLPALPVERESAEELPSIGREHDTAEQDERNMSHDATQQSEGLTASDIVSMSTSPDVLETEIKSSVEAIDDQASGAAADAPVLQADSNQAETLIMQEPPQEPPVPTTEELPSMTIEQDQLISAVEEAVLEPETELEIVASGKRDKKDKKKKKKGTNSPPETVPSEPTLLEPVVSEPSQSTSVAEVEGTQLVTEDSLQAEPVPESALESVTSESTEAREDDFAAIPTKKSKKEKRKAKKGIKSTDELDKDAAVATAELDVSSEVPEAKDLATTDTVPLVESEVASTSLTSEHQSDQGLPPTQSEQHAHETVLLESSPVPENRSAANPTQVPETSDESVAIEALDDQAKASLDTESTEPPAPELSGVTTDDVEVKDLGSSAKKKAKKDKKRKGSQATGSGTVTPLAETTYPVQDTSVAKELVATEEPTITEGPVLAEEPTIIKEPTLAEEPTLTEESAPKVEPETEVLPASVASQDTTLPETSTIIVAEDEWAEPTKKSKKNKKKRKGSLAAGSEPSSGTATPVVDEPNVVEEAKSVNAVVVEKPLIEEPLANEESPPVEEPTVIEGPIALEEPAVTDVPVVEEPMIATEIDANDTPVFVEEPAAIEQPATTYEAVASGEPVPGTLGTADEVKESTVPEPELQHNILHAEDQTDLKPSRITEAGSAEGAFAEADNQATEVPKKKSKKEKKRRSAKNVESEDVSSQGPSTPVEPSEPSSSMQNAALAVGAAGAIAAAALLDASHESLSSQDFEAEHSKGEDRSISEPAAQDTPQEDEWPVSTKKAKKDKKRKGSKPEPELSSDIAGPAQIEPDTTSAADAEPPTTDKEVETENIDVKPITSDPHPKVEEAQVPLQQVIPAEVQTDTVETIAAPPAEPIAEPLVEVQADEEWAPTSKKSKKKDKKRKGSQAATSEPPSGTTTPAEDKEYPFFSADDKKKDVPVDEIVESTAKEETVTGSGPQNTQIEDEWASTKKTKKDKKRKGSKVVEPAESVETIEPVAPIDLGEVATELDIPTERQSDTPATADKELVSSPVLDDSAAVKEGGIEAEGPFNAPEDSVKILSEASQEPLGEPSDRLTPRPETSGVQSESYQTREEDLDIQPESLVAQPAALETQPNEDWSQPTKMSKKDKRKAKKTGLDSPPDETPSSTVEPATVPDAPAESLASTEHVEPADSQVPEPPQSINDVASDDFWQPPTKKSKKKGKKASSQSTSGITTPVLQEEQAMPEQPVPAGPARLDETATKSLQQDMPEADVAKIEATASTSDPEGDATIANEAAENEKAAITDPDSNKSGTTAPPQESTGEELPLSEAPTAIDPVSRDIFTDSQQIQELPEDDYDLGLSTTSKKKKKKSKKGAVSSEPDSSTSLVVEEASVPETLTEQPLSVDDAAELTNEALAKESSQEAPAATEEAGDERVADASPVQDKIMTPPATAVVDLGGTEAPVTEDVLTVEDTPATDNIQPAEDTAPVDEFPEFSATSKKGKKGKGKKKATSWEEEVLDATVPTAMVAAAVEATRETPSNSEVPEVEEEFPVQVSRKLSKKEKKRLKEQPLVFESDAPTATEVIQDDLPGLGESHPQDTVMQYMEPEHHDDKITAAGTTHGHQDMLTSHESELRPSSSHISHDPPFDMSGERKKAKTHESTDVELEMPVVSSLDISASFVQTNDDLHPELHEKPSRVRESPRLQARTEDLKERSRGSKARSDEHEKDKGMQDLETVALAGALTGGVAALAQKFGATKKQGKKKSIDKRIPRDDDMFDDALWEGSDRRPLEGTQLDTTADNFWDVPEDNDVGDDIMRREADKTDEPRPQIVEAAQLPEEIITSEGHTQTVADADQPRLVDLKRQDSETIPTGLSERARSKGKGRQHRARSRSPSPVQRAFSFPDDIADEEAFATRELELEQAEPALPPVQLVEDVYQTLRPVSSLDFRRSVSSLPPVREEGSDEDGTGHLHSSPQRSRKLQGPVDSKRGSGFSSASPQIPKQSLFKEEPTRDSGVVLRDWPETTPQSTPKQRETSQFETITTPARRSTSSVEEEAKAKSSHSKDKHRQQSPTGERGLRTRAATSSEAHRLPEPSPPPHTPEPEKRLSVKKRSQHVSATTPVTPIAAPVHLAPSPALDFTSTPGKTPDKKRSVSDALGIDKKSTPDFEARRSTSNTSIARLRTPEPLNLRPDSPVSLRSYAGTPPLRRVERRSISSDLRSVSLSQRNDEKAGSGGASIGKPSPPSSSAGAAAIPTAIVAGAAALGAAELISRAKNNETPIANEGRVRAKDMTDVYDGYGEGRIGSPRSPTRPHSMRRRQSMQVLELESRVDQLQAENRLLAEARAHVETTLSQKAANALADRDGEIDNLKRSLQQMQREVERLTQINEGLSTSTSTIAVQHHERVRQLEAQHAEAMRALHAQHEDVTRELQGMRSSQVDTSSLEQKDAEIANLQVQLEAANARIREMQDQILAANPTASPDYLNVRDEDHFDTRCHQLCSHVQQWVLRFSKFSDMRACRQIAEINDEKVVDRLDNAVLDGSDVDAYLRDRVRRRDIFMSMTMNMIWEFVFTRYLFGMDREQRQKLKTLEKQLSDVGPPHAVRQWRAVTLTLLSRRPQFREQRNQDTEAVVQAVLSVLVKILPPPSNLEDQIQAQLRRVMREAVDLAIEMRTQRAEYMMLPMLQPEYDDAGELIEVVRFNPALMNERSGGDSGSSNDELAGATVRIVLFPLVVKKGDDDGRGDEEIVVCPAQVLIARAHSSRRSVRMVTPSSDAGGASLFARSIGGNGSNVTMSNAGPDAAE